VRRAFHDPALTITVVRAVPLLYAEGADPALDRPAHVRSASGLAWVGAALAVVQDDANFVALADPETGLCRAVTLPAGEGGLRQFDDLRGNKRFKLDLEACTAAPDLEGGELLVAFGSGSTSRRERVLLVRDVAGASPEVALVEAPAFYAGLRAATAFAGSELNVEGAAYRDGRILLMNRGNGAPSGEREPVDALCPVEWPALLEHLRATASAPAPRPREIVRYSLGEAGGQRLTFTDCCAAGGALLFTAAAEDSPNAVDDGPVTGSAVGWIDGAGEARVAVLRGRDGRALAKKVEGVAPGIRPGTLLLCTDPDEPDAASELLEVELSGTWPA
jgi:hypothetical protein